MEKPEFGLVLDAFAETRDDGRLIVGIEVNELNDWGAYLTGTTPELEDISVGPFEPFTFCRVMEVLQERIHSGEEFEVVLGGSDFSLHFRKDGDFVLIGVEEQPDRYGAYEIGVVLNLCTVSIALGQLCGAGIQADYDTPSFKVVDVSKDSVVH